MFMSHINFGSMWVCSLWLMSHDLFKIRPSGLAYVSCLWQTDSCNLPTHKLFFFENINRHFPVLSNVFFLIH